MSSFSGDPGVFIPTTELFETDDSEELFVQLRQVTNDIALAVNLKDTGYYTLEETVNSQNYFSAQTDRNTTPYFRPVFRKVINFGALPNSSSKAVAHGISITSNFRFTRIYATATNPGNSFIPIPFASPTLSQNISLTVGASNVTITTGSNRSAFTTCYVVLEYIKEAT